MWVWSVPDAERRRRILPWVFARIVALEARRVHVLGAGDGAGVAIWVPPGARETTRRDFVRARFPLLPLRLGRDAYARVEAFQRDSRMLLGRFGYGSAWFLSGLGVDPAAQRRGVGRALVRWGLDRARAAGRDALLLTSNADNIPFYERLEFEVVAEDEVPRGGVRTWVMKTRPR